MFLMGGVREAWRTEPILQAALSAATIFFTINAAFLFYYNYWLMAAHRYRLLTGANIDLSHNRWAGIYFIWAGVSLVMIAIYIIKKWR
jgi:hypothetical protein